ncbi:zinc-binding protein A33-like [Puntigrus tetrazona]|uniref:zinc-binding protein A33-like n=1 Tax=Puntigrus tetrazona TaxID=1606681 RepID=UPI001C8AC2FA|nr:zinc-binding protein A33-like [Puntigrus tetrazona]
MAEALSFMEEDLTCLICCDIFTDPVTLKCSHSLCEECLRIFWKTQDAPQCPVCRKTCSQDEPTKSLAFRGLCESFKKRKLTAVLSGDVCPEHKEALKLFCLDDQQPICVVCYTSKKHENHKCSPVDEAAGNLKGDLKTQIDRLQETLEKLKKAQESCVKQVELSKEHTSMDENQIKKEFEKLHQFLRDEEEKQIRSLRKEKDRQDGKLKARMKELSKQISDLSERIAAVWQDMEAENITFLQNYSRTLKRLKRPSVPNKTPEEEYQHHHLQTMIFTTWARMQNLVEKSPVTLDADTASSKLLVSDDCTSVEYKKNKLHVSDNPKRLYVGVLASQGFSSGEHCWDVEVRNNNNWTLGVVGEMVNRKVLYKMDPKSRFWCFRYVGNEYKKGNKPVSHIKINERPNVIRLQLDCEKGELRFIDPFRNRSLCTYTGGFPEKVFPYFCSGDVDRPLNVFAAKKQTL